MHRVGLQPLKLLPVRHRRAPKVSHAAFFRLVGHEVKRGVPCDAGCQQQAAKTGQVGRTEGDEKLLERQDLADDPCTVHAIVASVRRLRKQQT